MEEKMGYKGDCVMDCGYFYCPPIPLTDTPCVLPPEAFQPKSISDEIDKYPRKESRLDKRLKLTEDAMAVYRLGKLVGLIPKY